MVWSFLRNVPWGGTTFGRPEGSKTKPRQMKKGGINHEKGCPYGTHRVIEPAGVLPQPALKLIIIWKFTTMKS